MPEWIKTLEGVGLGWIHLTAGKDTNLRGHPVAWPVLNSVPQKIFENPDTQDSPYLACGCLKTYSSEVRSVWWAPVRYDWHPCEKRKEQEKAKKHREKNSWPERPRLEWRRCKPETPRGDGHCQKLHSRAEKCPHSQRESTVQTSASGSPKKQALWLLSWGPKPIQKSSTLKSCSRRHYLPKILHLKPVVLEVLVSTSACWGPHSIFPTLTALWKRDNFNSLLCVLTPLLSCHMLPKFSS